MMALLFFALIGLAILRILYLTRNSAIDAAAEIVTFPARLLADIRRNGKEVLKTVFWWIVLIAILCFIAFLCSLV